MKINIAKPMFMMFMVFVVVGYTHAGAPNPFAHWNFSGAGSTIIDVTNNGNNGITEGYSASPYIAGPVGNGIYTGGTSRTQYISVTNTGLLNNMDEFTLSAWIKPLQYRSYNVILAKVTPGRDFVMQLTSNGRLNAHFHNGSYQNCYSPEAIPLNTWTHVAASLEETTSPTETAADQKKWTLYVNGKKVKQCAVAPGLAPGWTGSKIAIGNMYKGAPYTFPGRIDEVKIFNRVLSHNEVLREVNDGGAYHLTLNRSLMLHDSSLDISMAQFDLKSVMDRLASTVRARTADKTVTGTSLFAGMWRTVLNPNGQTVPWQDCTDPFHGATIECRPNEGAQALNASTAMARYKPLALVNRFDLRDQVDFEDCGEARIVYGFNRLTGRDRNFIIFEALIDNPKPGNPAGCIPVANLWANISKINSATGRVMTLKNFYFNGLSNEGIAPIIDFRNFLSGTGQIRTNMFMSGSGQDWLLKEFKIEFPFNRAHINPVSVKSNPIAQKFAVSPGATSPWWYMSNLDTLLTDTDSFFLKVGADSWNNGQSHASGATNENNFTTNTNSGFKSTMQGQLAKLNSPLTVDQVLNRTEAMTCGGCHMPSVFGLTAANSIGKGKSWPSATFVHVDENRRLSPALTGTFLPARKADLEYFLNQVDAQNIGVTDGVTLKSAPALEVEPAEKSGKRSG
ncbi:LamG domain-containing protein [Teredinibacter franksiae]|uniref:LamG domain-containing protein n=1 Tax=Teredinibacter franksiae TaxID=2761453 RepID=UPI0016238217|nr:LamG domain-containing protein [Teredinibacter franksiae]